MNMLKKIIIVLSVVFLASCGGGDKLFPKKYIGNYAGMQESYEITANEVTVEVKEAEYSLVLDYGQLWLTTPRQKITAKYNVKAETDMYYALNVQLENGVVEEWKLWKKGGRLIRETIKPEPNIIFLKQK